MKKVIIIGAGILGATAAYELVQRDIEVVLIDKHAEGRATSAAAGIICPWIAQRRNKAWYALAKNGAAYYERLISDLHADGKKETGYKKVGAIRLHTDLEKLEELKQMVEKRKEEAPEIGEISLLNEIETKEKFPFLNDTYHSLFIEGAARVDGRSLRESLIQASVKHGATYIEGEAELIHSEREVNGVKVNNQTIEADMTIATNGVWMPALLAPLGINLNILSQKGEIIHLHEKEIDTSTLPVVNPPNNQYLLCFDNGKIVIGATRERRTDFNTEITAGGIHSILDQALHVAPNLADCAITETRVGFRPFTGNHLPIFGSVPNVKKILIANGLGASGLTTGPYIGLQLAKMVNEETPDVSIENYNVAQAIKK